MTNRVVQVMQPYITDESDIVDAQKRQPSLHLCAVMLQVTNNTAEELTVSYDEAHLLDARGAGAKVVWNDFNSAYNTLDARRSRRALFVFLVPKGFVPAQMLFEPTISLTKYTRQTQVLYTRSPQQPDEKEVAALRLQTEAATAIFVRRYGPTAGTLVRLPIATAARTSSRRAGQSDKR